MSVKDKDTLKIFAGTTGLHLANGIVKYLELQLGAGETKVFPDGELLVNWMRMCAAAIALWCFPHAVR